MCEEETRPPLSSESSSSFTESSALQVKNEERVQKSPSKVEGIKTLELNDQKAGMSGLDKEAINTLILEASKGTSFFLHQQKRQARIDAKIKDLLAQAEILSEADLAAAKHKVDQMVLELERSRDLSQTIVHVDMDMFYAAVEIRDRPELKDVPMAVGSLSMLSTSNYVARKYGVRAAMPGFIGKKLCPKLVLVPPNFEKYRAVSKEVQAIFRDFDSDFSTVSLDEAYLNITAYLSQKEQEIKSCLEGCHQASSESGSSSQWNLCPLHQFGEFKTLKLEELPACVVSYMRQRIARTTQLTASAGIAPNTLLAKVCSDQNKPNGQFWLRPNIGEIKAFVASLPIRKVWGIGPVQGQLLNALGIETCTDLWNQRYRLSLLFYPTSFRFYLQAALGISSVDTKSDCGPPKSKSVEETFGELSEPAELIEKCRLLSEELCWDLKQAELMGRVVSIKMKTVQFDVHTRSTTLSTPTNEVEVVFPAARKLLEAEIASLHPQPLKLRLLGVRMSSFMAGHEEQPTLSQFLKNGPHPSHVHCPVCGKEQPSKPALFNQHLDSCLKSSTASNNQVESLQNDSPHSPNCENDTFSSESKEDEQLLQNVLELTEGQSSSEEGSLEWTCPVCNHSQMYQDLIEFNRHVDECLNRRTIRELAKQEDTRKRVPPDCSTSSKKQRKKKESTRRIDDYFLHKS